MSSYDRYKRKRKRATFIANVGSQLHLDQPTPSSVHDEIPDDEKVTNYLTKLRKDVNVNTFLKIVVTSSEAEFFVPETIKTIKDSFKINDITVSPSVAGSIDRFVSLVGEAQSIVRGALFVAYLLNAKLNNFTKSQLFTLKSNNYRIAVLAPPHLPRVKTPSSISASITNSHHLNGETTLHLHTVTGDFSGCFHVLMRLAEELATIGYIEDAKITQLRVFGNTTDPNFFQRSEFKENILIKNKNRLVDFIDQS